MPNKNVGHNLDPNCLQRLGQSFLIFRFTDPTDPNFRKLKKKKKYFLSILFFVIAPTRPKKVPFFKFVTEILPIPVFTLVPVVKILIVPQRP